MSRRSRKVIGAAFALSLVLAACGDDDGEDEATGTTEEGEGTTPTAEDGTATTGDDGAAGETVEVTGVNYAYTGLPETVEAGTQISFTNDAASELHEFVAIQLPEDEDRPVSELVQLPAEELNTLGEPTDVILALPGQTDAPGAVEGDGVLDEPGRYAIICAIPTGIDPQAYLDAAAEAEGGPPEVEGGGPPHFLQGMYAELTVE